MAITIKDFLATLLAGISAYIHYAQVNAIILPFIDSHRATILALAIVGMILCEYGIPSKEKLKSSYVVLSVAAIFTVTLIIFSLITGNKTISTQMTVITISIWLISTFRHMLNI